MIYRERDGLQVRAQRVHVVLLPLAHEERAHHAAHHEHARPRGAQLRDRGRGHGQEGGAHGVAPVVEQRAERRRRALLWQNEKKIQQPHISAFQNGITRLFVCARAQLFAGVCASSAKGLGLKTEVCYVILHGIGRK